MSDFASPVPEYAPPRGDPTAVMGRRILAWVIDIAVYLAVAVSLFAATAEFVEIPAGLGLDACDQLRQVDDDAANGCILVGDRAYVTSTGDSGIQTLASFGYLAFFVILQGLAGGSPGKLLTGLRVVNEQGQRAGVGRSAVRTLLWVIDGAPWIIPLVGFIVGLTSTGHRRVGDIVAKTYVIRARDAGTPVAPGGDAATGWGTPPPAWEATVTGHEPRSMMPSAPPASSTPPSPATLPASSQSEAPSPQSALPGQPSAPPGDPTTAPPPTEDASLPLDEVSTPVDEAPPDMAPDPEWWSGPEAGEWSPPETPNEDITIGPTSSPTAGPTPFVAPGAVPEPAVEAAPEAPAMPPPQWDQARNTYIQWDPSQQLWLQWDTIANRWKHIDT